MNEFHPQRWIGRGGIVAWPPRSPDFTPLDFYLWGTLKEKDSTTEKATRDTLVQRIKDAVAAINRNRQDIHRVTGSMLQVLQFVL